MPFELLWLWYLTAPTVCTFLHECRFLVVNAAWFHIHPIYVFTQSIIENFFWNHSSRHHTLEVRKEWQHDGPMVTTTLGEDITEFFLRYFENWPNITGVSPVSRHRISQPGSIYLRSNWSIRDRGFTLSFGMRALFYRMQCVEIPRVALAGSLWLNRAGVARSDRLTLTRCDRTIRADLCPSLRLSSEFPGRSLQAHHIWVLWLFWLVLCNASYHHNCHVTLVPSIVTATPSPIRM